MKTLKYEYPHPVLNKYNSDYVDCSFDLNEINIEDIKINEDYIFIPVSYYLSSPGLCQLIEEKKATVTVSIYSPKTAFRTTEHLASGNNTLKIQKNSVADEIEITGYIVANNKIENFYCEEHNKDFFGNTEFEIRQGDKLGETDTVSIPLDSSELQAPIVSVINISEDPNLECSIQPDFNDDKINIRLNHELNVAYCDIKNNLELRRFLAAIIVYPVLVDAISIMKSRDKYEFEDKRWYKSIERRLDKENINLDESISIAVIANKILGDIVKDALISFKEKMDLEYPDQMEEIERE